MFRRYRDSKRREREKIQNVDIERNRYIKGRYRKGYTVEIERDVR